MSFWGKARPAPDAPSFSHPVALHSLDVAAVAQALLEAHPERAAAAAQACGWANPNWIRLVVFLVALHDLGKFSRAFQAKSESAWPASVLGAYRPAPGDPHDTVGMQLWRRQEVWATLSTRFPGWDSSSVGTLIGAVVGHHGRPALARARLERNVACQVCVQSAEAFVQEAIDLLDPPTLPEPGHRSLVQAQWWLAGLTVLCDWLGSSQRWFPYAGDRKSLTLRDYWHGTALVAARQAVAASGLLPCPVSKPGGVAALRPEIVAPSPVQALAADMTIPRGPTCTFIEDVTGSGKTEAALVLAHRIMASGGADGLFVALPTMATADAMYERLSRAYRRLFADGSPSLVLAHGKAATNDLFTGSVLRDAARAEATGSDAADESASAQCAAWLADDRRLALLAHVGAGTIDQTFLSVLATRHAPLRMQGLARKVLIIDEAHACDAYMREELSRLLEFHAALGGSAIILSATLAHAQRTKLANAFRAGLQAAPATLSRDCFPLLTCIGRGDVQEHHEPTRAELHRRVGVKQLADDIGAIAVLVDAHRRGACGAWVCNTVDRVHEAAASLRHHGIEPIVFHSRFAMGDRLAVQERVLSLFGPASTTADRAPGGAGRIVIATQVIEQSLDLDFDVLVSDLAPIDLLIQRAGRLWRHQRGGRVFDEPLLHVVSPAPGDDVDGSWGSSLGGTRFVYDLATLWRSARTLFQAGAIVSPDNVRALVEAVHGQDAEAVPAALSRAEETAEGEDACARGIAQAVLLDVDDGYRSGQGMWDSDILISTRLDSQQSAVRLAIDHGGVLAPLCAHQDPMRAWALSEVALPGKQSWQAPVPPEFFERVEAMRSGWPLWQRDLPLVVLRVNPDDRAGWVGDLQRGDRLVTMRYDRQVGLQLPVQVRVYATALVTA